MSANYVRVCNHILGEFFGQVVQKVAVLLLQDGPQALKDIAIRLRLPLAQVKDALRILLQHNLATFFSKSEYTLPEYSVIHENVFFLVRLPRALDVVEEKLGAETRGLFEEIVCRGQLPLSKLLFICGLKHFKSNPVISPAEIIIILRQYYGYFEKLPANHYACRSSDLVEDAAALVPKFAVNEKTKYALPPINFEAIALKINSNNADLSDQEDSTIPWKIDIYNFNRDWRDSIILKALKNRYKDFVDMKIFDILTSNSFSACMDGLPNETPAMSYGDIRIKLGWRSNSENTIKTLEQQLDTILSDPKTFVDHMDSPGGGHYSINYVNAMTYLMYETVEKIVQQRLGFYAARIFRLIKENKFVEQDRVTELGMIPQKEAKHLTFLLMQENFVKMKEVRKTYTPSVTTNKVFFLFYIDIYQVINSILESCYQAIANSYERTAVVKYNNRMLLAKEERIARILATVRAKEGVDTELKEAQLKEIEEMITPPERDVLHKVNQQKSKLICGMFNVDETIFILEEYLHCQRKKIVDSTPSK